MKTWIIHWYTIMPRAEGGDIVEGTDIGDVRRQYAKKYPRRRIDTITLSTLEPV